MMPAHRQAVCRHCGCGDCNVCDLVVCSVCGAYEGGLTTDCPGVRVDFDTQQEVYKTDLDYTDAKGWFRAGGVRKGGLAGWPNVNFEKREGQQ